MEWIRKELARGEPAVLLFHHPVKTDHFRLWAHKEDMVSEKNEPEFMALCKVHKENIRGVFVGHGHQWVKDKLYKKIPVYETSSFGDKPKVLGYLVGMGTENNIIKTQKIYRSTPEVKTK
jgi:hypothetical protein